MFCMWLVCQTYCIYSYTMIKLKWCTSWLNKRLFSILLYFILSDFLISQTFCYFEYIHNWIFFNSSEWISEFIRQVTKGMFEYVLGSSKSTNEYLNIFIVNFEYEYIHAELFEYSLHSGRNTCVWLWVAQLVLVVC